MSDAERETLSLGLAHGHSLRTMAAVLGRAPSTVSRESARNAAEGQPYRACTAQTLAAARARQPRRSRKLLAPWLWQYVRTHLVRGCSPEQIAGRLLAHPAMADRGPAEACRAEADSAALAPAGQFCGSFDHDKTPPSPAGASISNHLSFGQEGTARPAIASR